MIKSRLYGISVIVAVVCLSLVSIIAISNIMSEYNFRNTKFREADFPLDIDLSKTIFNVGDKISGIVTITNRSGKNIDIISNGAMPCTYLHNIKDTTYIHPERMGRGVAQNLKTDDKMSENFEWIAKESGTYVLNVHYRIEVNGVELRSELEDITIEVS